MNRPRLAIIALLILIAVLYGYYIYLSIDLGSHTAEYTAVRRAIDDYKKQNALAREKLLTEMSLTRIKEKALNQGFVQAKFIILLDHK